MSKILVHHSKFGALEIAGVPGVVVAGEPFTVDDDLAAALLVQSDLYSIHKKNRKTEAPEDAAEQQGDPA